VHGVFIGAAGDGPVHVSGPCNDPSPVLIVGTDRDPPGFKPCATGSANWRRARRRLICQPDEAGAQAQEHGPNGFDDIVVYGAVSSLIETRFPDARAGGVLNIFAGVRARTMATLDMSDVVTKNVRIVGTTVSTICGLVAIPRRMAQARRRHKREPPACSRSAACRSRSAATASSRALPPTGTCGRSSAAGWSPIDALKAGTITPARALGFKDIGSLEPGKLADLVILNADPLADIQNSDDVSKVMLNGRLYDAMTLNEEVTGTRKRQPYYWEEGGAAPAGARP
jgi:hypothetical protein